MEGSVIANRYIINGVIGSGGMAIVYRGYDRETGDEVAIKVLRSEFMEDENYVRRFEKESQIAIKYSHRNIVRTIEVGCEEGRHYIVMEYVVGMTLKQYIDRNGRLKPAEAVRIGRQICDALFYAHSHQLIHRDIKPQNILINGEGNIKVADFGIAKAPDSSTMTISGSNVLGSVHYISPEQARGVSTDEKADIYSMGIVLYEMVTGTVPFTGDSPVAVALKHLQDAPKPPREINPDLSKALELVILKAIAKDPSVRYDNAREMARDLERTLLEPEGNYIHIKKPPEDTESPRPVHILRGVGVVGSGTAAGQSVPRGSLRPPKRRTSPWNVILYILLTVTLLGTIFYAAGAIIRSLMPKEVTVRNYVGMDQNIATAQLNKMSLLFKIEPATSETIAAGVVMNQDPPGGGTIPSDGTVVLTVSQGPESVSVPDLSGLSQKAAGDMLVKMGLKLGGVVRENSTKPKDTVVRQEPPAKQMLQKGKSVDIWLAMPADTNETVMPDVLLLERQAALKKIFDTGLIQGNLAPIQPINSSLAEGTVLRQSPEEGVPLEVGTKVVLYVSSGTPPIYAKKYTVPAISLPAGGAKVRIVFMDGQDSNVTVFDQALAAADKLPAEVTLESDSLGQKTVRVLVDGTEKSNETVTFVEEDAR